MGGEKKGEWEGTGGKGRRKEGEGEEGSRKERMGLHFPHVLKNLDPPLNLPSVLKRLSRAIIGTVLRPRRAGAVTYADGI